MSQILQFPQKTPTIETVRAEMLRLASAAAEAIERGDRASADSYTEELRSYTDRLPAEVHQQLQGDVALQQAAEKGVKKVLDFVLQQLLM